VSVGAFRVSAAHTAAGDDRVTAHRAPMQPVRGYVLSRLSAHISGFLGRRWGSACPLADGSS